jgi:ABC-2 type transport system ATP-binding protein
VTNNLGKRYGSTVALETINLVVARGETVGLVGPNGSGKTTLLHLVAGLTRPDVGGATVCGAPAGTRHARSSLAFVPDDPIGFEELTVLEQAGLLRSLYEVGSEWFDRVTALLEAFSLAGRRDTRLGALSRGLRRQASFAAAFALGTPLVLVDEATATLDPEAVVVVRSILRAHTRGGASTLLATQDLSFAQEACDTVVLLERGVVIDAGAPGELCERHACGSLEDAFLSAVGRSTLTQDTERLLATL